MTTRTDPFPVDWAAWRAAWQAWRDAHAAHLGRTSYRFPGVNFLADERLGTWSINGRNVELSEVTMPVLGDREANRRGDRVRYVGITFATGAGADSALASTFAELESALGITEEQDQ